MLRIWSAFIHLIMCKGLDLTPLFRQKSSLYSSTLPLAIGKIASEAYREQKWGDHWSPRTRSTPSDVVWALISDQSASFPIAQHFSKPCSLGFKEPERRSLFVVECTTKIEEALTAHFPPEWLKTTVALTDAWKEHRYFSRLEDKLKITRSS